MKDLTGMKFGRLTVLMYGDPAIRKDGRRDTTFVCKCDCGNIIVVRGASLKNGNTSSCGCKRIESISQLRRTHGMTQTRLYRIWLRMKQRCNNENSDDYQYYGAHGISVCDEWLNDYKVFEEWSMNNGYGDSLTIDRIDVDGNYSPENCRWTTRKIQSNNTHSNRKITYGNKTQTLSEWSSETGIQRQTIIKRMDTLGWSIEKSLTEPVKIHKNTYRKDTY